MQISYVGITRIRFKGSDILSISAGLFASSPCYKIVVVPGRLRFYVATVFKTTCSIPGPPDREQIEV